MLPFERKEKIKEELLKDYTNINELAQLLEVSEITIRRDLKQLEKEGVIVPDDGPGTDEEKRTMGIAKFLRHSTRLDKKLLGEYISRPDQVDLLKAFMGLFNFEGVSQHQERGAQLTSRNL